MKKEIKALVLMTILLMSFATSLGIVKGQTTNTQSQSDNNLQKTLDKMFVKELGLSSNITAITSSVNLSENTKSGGFTYAGRFSSGSSQYFVQSNYLVQRSQVGANGQNSVITCEKTTIRGSINSTYDYKEVNVTSNNCVMTHRTLNMQITNGSTEFFDINSHISSSLETKAILTNRATIDQNATNPIGTYQVNTTSQNNSTSGVVTMPDGSQITVSSGQIPPDQASNVQSEQNRISPMDSQYDDHGNSATYCIQWKP